MSIYLDYNATAPLRPEARAAMHLALDLTGNPSSVHSGGRAARGMIEAARCQVADLVKVRPSSVTFVSGGTEANAQAILSARVAGFDRVIVSAAEHPAVVENAIASGMKVEICPLNPDGVADLEWLDSSLSASRPTLVCLMLANNETGVIQPVQAASELVRGSDGWLHVDAVQAAGKINIDFNALGADSMALSSHKLGGPTGAGALIAGQRSRVSRIVHGGGQEQGRRPGTENLSGIVGMGAAAMASLAQIEVPGQSAIWRDALEARLVKVGAVVIGKSASRLPQTLCLAYPEFDAQLQIMSLDLADVMVSAGAACSSGKMQASPVIAAMGMPELASCAIRLSGGWASVAEDWLRAGDVWMDALVRHQAKQKLAREVA